MNGKSQELRVKRLEPNDRGATRIIAVRDPGSHFAEANGGHSAYLALDSRLSALDYRRGFTLIELLIAIAIIATLSALFLGASRAAMEHSRAARTKSTIAKLHTLIMEQWASYETRRVDVFIPDGATVEMGHDYRLLALRELMKYEMPDRWSDFVALNDDNPASSGILRPLFFSSSPTISKIYFRRFMKAAEASENDADKLANHQAAECLYLTVMLLTGDGEARTMFAAQDIGDTDGDGAPEFLDGWGNPIAWSRWPAGFALNGRSALMSGDTVGDHDPFDPFRRHLITATPPADAYTGRIRPYIEHLRNTGPAGGFAPGYRLVPLIFSSGPDGISDINTSGQTSAVSSLLDPYAIDPDGPTDQSFPPDAPAYEYGLPWDDDQDGDDNSIDNIHNHLQDNR